MSEEAVISVSPSIPIKVHPWAKRFIVWFLSFTAFVLSCVAVGSCRFIKLARAPADGAVSIQYFGLFQVMASGTCISIDLIFTSISSSAEAARAFGVMASLFGGIAMLSLLSMFCLKMDRFRWRATGFLLIACSVFQVFTFIIFDSPGCKDDMVKTKCHLDEGGACSICAMFFYIFAAVGVFLHPLPNSISIDFAAQPYTSLSQNRQNTITEVINADGSKTVFVTRLEHNKDESKNDDKTEYDEESPSVQLEERDFRKPPPIDNEELEDAPVNPFERKQRKPLVKESLVQREAEQSEMNPPTRFDGREGQKSPLFEAKFGNEEPENKANISAHSEEINERKPLVNGESDDEESYGDEESDSGEESDDDEETNSAYQQKKERADQPVEEGYDSEELENDDYNLSAYHGKTNSSKRPTSSRENTDDDEDDDSEEDDESEDDDDASEESYERSIPMDDDGSSSRKMATQASDEYNHTGSSNEYRYSKAFKEYKHVRTESV